MNTRCVIIVGFTLVFAGGLPAQDPPAVPVGSRVRVAGVSGSGWSQVGVVRLLRGDTLVLDVPELRVPFVMSTRELTHIEVSGGRHRHARQGARIGGIIGAAAGLSFLIREARGGCHALDIGDDWDDFRRRFCWSLAVTAPFSMGGMGAGLGALIGLLVVNERWDAVPMDGLRVGLAPLPAGRLGLGAAVSF
jgi:hypothetical protein